MNILMIPSWYITKDNPIKGSFFREQALMLQKRNNQIFIMYVALHPIGEKIRETIEEYVDEGMNTVILHIHSYGFARNTFVLKTVLLKHYDNLLKRLFKKGIELDVIQAHSFMPAGVVAVSLGEKYDIPVVTTEHSSLVHTKSYNKQEYYYLKKVVERSKIFACVSEALKSTISECCRNRVIEVIPNNLSDNFRYKSIKENGKFSFVCVGNLIPSKRQGFLIDCFAKAFKDKNVELFIIGNGIMKNKLEEKVRTLKVEKQIHIMGTLSRNEMVEFLNRKNVFVLLSKNETFGVAYIEALACGCPVIATKNGGAEEIVNDSNGILINVDSEIEAIHAMHTLYKNYTEYNLEAISEECIRKYSEETVYKITMEIYQKAVERRK